VTLDASSSERLTTRAHRWRRARRFVFQTFNLLTTLDARQNILLPLAIAANARPGLVRSLIATCGSVTASITVRRSSRAASSSASHPRR